MPEGVGPGVVIAVFGPTGVGKTAVAAAIAAELGIRVISCDALQLYGGFPVLTNQPAAREAALAPHALVGVLGPGEEWSAVAYGVEARWLVEEDLATRGWALVCGGTGLYLRAVLAPLSVPAEADPDLRLRLEERGEREGPPALHAELARLDPAAAAAIHPRNLRRVIRALEVVTLAGGPVWSARTDLWSPEYVHPTLVVGLTLDRPELYRRIDERTTRLLSGGAVEEVRRDHEDRAGAGASGMRPTAGEGRGIEKAIGYREIVRHLEGELSREETTALVAAATRRYARRQLTWMRRLGDAVIMDASHREPADLATDIIGRARSTVRRNTPGKGSEATVHVAKWQGLGNDYLIVEGTDLSGPLAPQAVGLLCDRHLGVGADGILVHQPPTGAVPGAVARMDIYNPDGSRPEMCGNGIRMFARYLRRTGSVQDDEFVIETPAGAITPRLLPGGLVSVDMGRARFRSDSIADPMAEGDVVDQELEALGGRHRFTFVDVGNPHCIIVVDNVRDLPLAEVGPAIEHLPLFPNRVNVEFVRAEADGSVTMRVWERGVGETQACGTGATAVGAAAVRLGLAESPVVVHLEGGDLEIEVGPDWRMIMTGPAEEVFAGTLSVELLARLGRPSR